MELEPVRENPKAHQCVCLLIKKIPGPETLNALKNLADGVDDLNEVVSTFREVKDKCHAMVNNPDQAFCQPCEDEGHPTEDTQVGLQNIVKESE
jgi:hypothetical protein